MSDVLAISLRKQRFVKSPGPIASGDYSNPFSQRKIVDMTGLSYPTVRHAIDLYQAGGWSAIRPTARGRTPGQGRVLSAEQEQHIQRVIIDKLMWGCRDAEPIRRTQALMTEVGIPSTWYHI
jgi:transposase